MSVPESFQDRSFRLALELLKLYRVLVRSTDVPRHFATQVLRAGTAIGANLEEAESGASRRDLAAKYTIALRETRECHYRLRLIEADQPQLAGTINDRLDDCGQLIAILTATVRKLRTTVPVVGKLILVLAAAGSISVRLSSFLSSLLTFGF